MSKLPITKQQLAWLHQWRRRLTTLTRGNFGRREFDLILIRDGDVTSLPPSSTRLNNVSFERVMARLESFLAPHDPTIGDRFRLLEEARSRGRCSAQQKWEIDESYAAILDAGLTYGLGALIERQCGGRTADPRELTPHEAFKVIEMLHAVLGRQIVEAK